MKKKQTYRDLFRLLDKEPAQPPEEIEEFAAQVTKFVGRPAKCGLYVGTLSAKGQEYKMVLSLQGIGYCETLFSVHVPPRGKSVTFHQSGSKPEKNVGDLRKRLMLLLHLPGVMELLRQIKGRASKIGRAAV